MSHHYNTNSSGKQGLFWEGNPRRPVRHHQDSWTKIKLRKIREFGSFEATDYQLLPGHPAASVQAEAAWTSRELVEFTPTNS